jgi:molybdopterin converting factor small subunit
MLTNLPPDYRVLALDKDTQETWILAGLKPTPEEEWARLRHFLGLSAADQEAMLQTVEVLFRRGHELVVSNYEYLLQNHETAAILGWEKGPDPQHLAERRRFFTVWLARTLGMDLGLDFARYLYRAGQIHAAHGPRQVHVPDVFVTGAISLVQATFARYLHEEMPGADVIPAALTGWNKVLSMHLHMMLLGYQSALELDRGEFAVPVSFFGKLRALAATPRVVAHASRHQTVEETLRKLFNYFPQLREAVFEPVWQEGERLDASGTPWLTVSPAYRVRPGWRLLVNGRDVAYSGGLDLEMSPGDEIQFFPPGR